jgi:DNA-binding transcriptional LysR family regulator
MDLEWLKDFLSLCQTLNFTRAAEARNVTQSAFSRRIHNLELWVGAPLVDRGTYPASLTAAGQLLRTTAEEVLRDLEQVRGECRGKAASLGKALRFAALHTLALTFFPPWLRRLEADLGPLPVRMIADNVHDCLEALFGGGCDLMLAYSHPAVPLAVDGRRFPSQVLATDRILPMCAADRGEPLFALSPMAEPPPYLAYTPDSFLGRLVQSVIDRAPALPPMTARYENSMSEALKTMALAGAGIAWLPLSAAERDLAEGRLAVVGDRRCEVAVDIRLYRNAEDGRRDIDRLWTAAARLAQG